MIKQFRLTSEGLIFITSCLICYFVYQANASFVQLNQLNYTLFVRLPQFVFDNFRSPAFIVRCKAAGFYKLPAIMGARFDLRNPGL